MEHFFPLCDFSGESFAFGASFDEVCDERDYLARDAGGVDFVGGFLHRGEFAGGDVDYE